MPVDGVLLRDVAGVADATLSDTTLSGAAALGLRISLRLPGLFCEWRIRVIGRQRDDHEAAPVSTVTRIRRRAGIGTGNGPAFDVETRGREARAVDRCPVFNGDRRQPDAIT